MLETDCVKLLLGNRTGNDSGRGARSRETDGKLERIERAVRSGDAWLSRDVTPRRRNLD